MAGTTVIILKAATLETALKLNVEDDNKSFKKIQNATWLLNQKV